MANSIYFGHQTFIFLKDLAENNNREWFQANKRRYEDDVKEPAIRFIIDVGPHLKEISEHFVADPRPSGGSLFRIHQDVRFSRDRRPYKTNVGIQFRHKQGKDVHAPAFYLHVEPDNVFVALGIWRPDPGTLGKIRDAVVDDPRAWKRAVNGKEFRKTFEISGRMLSRPPRGYDPDHPLINDLKRQDFIGVATLAEEAVARGTLPRDFARIARAGAPLVKFLCGAVGLPF